MRRYLVILPADIDGNLEVWPTEYRGTYEEVEPAIVAYVDAHVDRGVDGGALEAWLIVGAIGTAHIVKDDGRPKCCIVRLALD